MMTVYQEKYEDAGLSQPTLDGHAAILCAPQYSFVERVCDFLEQYAASTAGQGYRVHADLWRS
jgi:hypothetical protein